MDGNQFDDLIRQLANRNGISRRAALKAAAAGVLAALGAQRSSDADAQVTQLSCGNQLCASNPGGCRPGCVCCVYTNPVTGTVTNSRCRPPGTCAPGTVACPAGQRFCPTLGRCAECCTATDCPDPANPCQNAICDGGVCGTTPVADVDPSASASCPDGHTCCGGGCTPLGTAANCGACGDVCDGPGETCGGGGTTGVCGCTPTTCFAAGKWCGTLNDGCGNVLDCGDCSTCPVITLDEPGCFYLDGYHFNGNWCWVPDRTWNVTTLGACREIDSCDIEGGDLSGGGCFKWAISSDTVIAPPWS